MNPQRRGRCSASLIWQILLARVPFAGRRGRVPGTREMVVSDLPYILVYRVRRDAIEVVSVVHGARRR